MASLSRFGLFLLLQSNITNTATKVETDISADIPARLSALEETVTRRLSSIESMLQQLQKDPSNCAEKLILRHDIARAINESRFTVAEEKMLELDEPAIVAKLVRDVSTNSDSDFKVILNLTRSVNETSLRSHILTNLYTEATQRDRISTLNMIALAKALAENNATAHFERLVDQITVTITARLVEVMKSNESYQKNAEVRALSAAIADWQDVSEKVMTALVRSVYETVDTSRILEAVSNHSDTWQALVGVDNLIDRLKESHSFKGHVVLHIASHLAGIINRENQDPSVQSKALEVRNKVPGCLVNLFSLKTFCIKDKPYGILVAASDVQNKRKVVPSQRWKLTWTEEKMSFENELGFGLGAKGFNTWLAEPHEDACFLRNLKNDEYLYGKRETHNNQVVYYRFLKKKKDVPQEEIPAFLWQILSC